MQKKEIDNLEDKLLALASGNHHAFRQIFDFYRNRVYGYALRYLKSEELAEEIVQEIFLKLWLNRKKTNEISNFGGYLRRLSVNRVIDEIRSQNSKRNAVLKSIQDWSEQDSTTEKRIYDKDSASYINNLLLQLPKQQRLVYTLCNIEGLKQKEVAEKLQLSTSTVKNHLKEAVKNLRRLLADNPNLAISIIFTGLTLR